MTTISGPVVVKGGVLNAAKILDGQVAEARLIRVLLPSGSNLTSETIQATIWKNQIKQLGFARCVHDRCAISFLSVKGMEAHVKTCKGFSNPGDYVLCPLCGERFKTFSTMAKHHVKAHGCSAKSAPRPETVLASQEIDEGAEEEVIDSNVTHRLLSVQPQHSSSDYVMYNNDDDEESLLDNPFESREALRDRIMAESRMISTARPRGRPRKSVEPIPKDISMSGLQYKDPFDMDEPEMELEDDKSRTVQYVQLQPMTDAFKQAVSPEIKTHLKRRLSVDQPLNQDLVQMRTMDGKLVWVKKAILSLPQTAKFDRLTTAPILVPRGSRISSASPPTTSSNIRHISVQHTFEDDLAVKEAKLADYQELVMKYEQLAEQATKMALEERTNQLLHYEKELKRREHEAKKKLAGAVEVLQKIQSEKHRQIFDEDGNDITPQEICDELTSAVVHNQSDSDETKDKETSVSDTDVNNSSENEEHLHFEIVVPELADTIVVQHEEIIDAEDVFLVPTPQDSHLETNLEATSHDINSTEIAHPAESTIQSDEDLQHLDDPNEDFHVEKSFIETAVDYGDREVTVMARPSIGRPRRLINNNNTPLKRNNSDHLPGASSGPRDFNRQDEASVPGIRDLERSSLEARAHVFASEDLLSTPNGQVNVNNVDQLFVEASFRLQNQLTESNRQKESKDSSSPAKGMKARRLNPPIDVPKMQREERRRKPAIDESEFILTTPASNAAKKRKLNQQNTVLPANEKELSTKSNPPEENTRKLPVLMVPEIIKLQSNSNKTSTEEENIGSIDNAKQDLPIELAIQKEPVLVPQIIQSNSEVSQKDEQFDHQESRQKSAVEINSDISEESSNCNDELAPNFDHTEELIDQSQPSEENFSAEFPEDEFLLDSLDGPSPSSHLAEDTFATKSQSVETTSSEQTGTPIIKPKRGRPSKKAQVEILQPEIGFSPQLVTSEFATPLEKPKRGRKKKETYSAPEPVSEPKPIYESIPGKRMRKKIDYRELSGEIDHSSAKALRQTRDVDTPMSGVENGNNVETVENGNNVETADPQSSTPATKSKRGRKRKIIVPEIHVEGGHSTNDNSTADISMTDGDVSLKNDVIKTPTGPGVTCGNCEMMFKNKSTFLLHAAALHGGLARPLGESQEFTEAEMYEAAKDSFTKVKKVACYRCNNKSFTTMLGLKYHLNSCGKSFEELESMKVQCEFCEFRGLPNNLKIHMLRHTKIREPAIDNRNGDDDNTKVGKTPETTSSGRIRRHAASKASIKVANAIKQLKSAEDGETVDETQLLDDEENSEDEEYTEQNNPEIAKMFRSEKNPDGRGLIYKCKLCEAVADTVNEIRKHAISSHSDELVEEEEDDDVDEEIEEDSSSENGDLRFDKYNDDIDDDFDKTTPKRPSSTFRNFYAPKVKALSHDRLMIREEIRFRKENYNQNLFERFHSCAENWIQIGESDLEDYLPKARSSLKFQLRFCQTGKESISEETTLGLFESTIQNDAATFFAGGPIWASAWCPVEGPKTEHIIALFAEQTFDSEAFIRPAKETVMGHLKSLIQLWTFRKSKNSTDLPVFSMGIAHDFGRVRSLQWCPSGGQCDNEGGLSRLGLLAAGSEDGTIRIFPVPQFESLPNQSTGLNIYKCDDVVVTLRRPDDGRDSNGQLSACVKVVWFRGRRHRTIAATFSDGHVALWDLDTTSSLLRDDENRSIFPYRFFRAHLRNNQTFLDLSSEADENGFPLHLVTGSTDRMFTSWDLAGVGDVPVRESRRLLITDVAWLDHFPGNVIISHDDSCLQSNTRSVIMDMKMQDHNRNVSVVAQNSAIWSQAYSPLKNFMISCTAAGEVVLFVMPHPSRNMNTIKELNHCRVVVYRTDMGKFNLDPNPGKQDATYLKTYDAMAKEEPVIQLLDMPTHNFALTIKDELLSPRCPNTMVPENPEIYPLASINCVSINTNLNDLSLLFSGGQSGLGRIHHLSMLDSY